MNNTKVLVKSIILATIFSFSSLPCQASDSLWLLCDNGKLAMNLLEHRSADGQGRVTSLTLLLGMNNLSGQLTNTDSGKVLLTSNPKNKTSFNGNVAVNYSKKVVSLNGILKLSGERFSINTQLQCKEMRVDLR
jgi:hypothetical protein